MTIYSEKVIRKARKLRKQDFSYKEIAKILKVPDTAVGRWCFGTKGGRGHSLREVKRNEELRKQITRDEEEFVKNKKGSIDDEEARFLASLLYWCEGSKYPTASRIDFVNSDARMIKTFIWLLRKGFSLDEKKFRVHLQTHGTHNLEELKKYWAEVLDISKRQFIKPTVTKPTGGRHRKDYKGTCTLRYYDYRVALKLIAIYETLALTVPETTGRSDRMAM